MQDCMLSTVCLISFSFIIQNILKTQWDKCQRVREANAVAAELERVRKWRGGGLISKEEAAGSRDEAGRKPAGDARLVSRRRHARAECDPTGEKRVDRILVSASGYYQRWLCPSWLTVTFLLRWSRRSSTNTHARTHPQARQTAKEKKIKELNPPFILWPLLCERQLIPSTMCKRWMLGNVRRLFRPRGQSELCAGS